MMVGRGQSAYHHLANSTSSWLAPKQARQLLSLGEIYTLVKVICLVLTRNLPRRAGVVGLSCALKLQSIIAEQSSSWQVVIASKEWPTSIPGVPQSHSVDYASMWAGAHVRPIPATSPQLRREAIRLKQTVAVFARMLKEDPSCGITQTRGVEYIDAPTDDYKGHSPETFEAQTGLPEFRELDLWELPDGVAFGFEYQTFCINSPVYCGNLLRKFVLKGGQTVQSDFKSEWEPFSLFDNVKLVVNASGTGFHDPRCFPTPGMFDT